MMTEFQNYPQSPIVSSRAEALIQRPKLSYITALIESFGNQHSIETNPDGKVLLAVAENKLCSQLLINKLAANLGRGIPPHILNYTSTFGLPEVRASISKFLSKYVFQTKGDGQEIIIDENNIVLGSGCCAMLIQLSILLFEPKDGILIPAPYYPAFNPDFMNFGNVHVHPIHGDNCNKDFPFGYLTRDSLTQSYKNALSSGHPPKAVLITNPSNPLGINYSIEELKILVEWCKEFGLHLIVDEIYALSQLDNSSSDTFVSTISFLQNNLGDFVHFLWSFSKDFGGSGLRVGVLYTQNKSLLTALGSSNDPMMASNLAQYAMSTLINDELFLQEYFQENSRQLLHSFHEVQNSLLPLGIEIMKSTNAAIFAFCDFSNFLSEPTFEGERELFQKLFQSGVLMTPGEACHCIKPGYFRLCYAFVSFESLQVGLNRIKQVLTQTK